MNFNPEQEEIIKSLDGAFLISAPVGTGKTTILSERVVEALSAGFRPEEILCLTFTNRAAEEMTARIRSRLNKDVFRKITIKTFHGFCATLIKEEARGLGLDPDFVIFEEEEQVEVMKDVLADHTGYLPTGENANKEVKGLLEKIYEFRLRSLENKIGCQLPLVEADKEFKKIAEEYGRALLLQNALDFNELVLFAIKALYQDEKISRKWRSRYKFIELDEFQDTHLSEYLIVKELAKESGNISFIGDLDQTIYGWRGSKPYLIKKLIKDHFPAVRELSLKTNYRFDPNLLLAVKSFLKSFVQADTKELESFISAGKAEKSIEVFAAHGFTEEIAYVIDNINKLRLKDPTSRIAVLVRANWLIKEAADIFKTKKVAHVTVDKYNFFRRQEIKDILAYLKIVFNRFDMEAAGRLLKRPARNIGQAVFDDIKEKGTSVGLRLADFLNFRNFNHSEPFADLLDRFDHGRIIVLDTETTGTDPLKDEVIQVFAVELINGRPGREFYQLLKNTRPVGVSEEVHGLSDEHLSQNGREAKKVFEELKKFIGTDPTVGHNVNFDISMLSEHGRRLKIDFSFREYYDTLDLARRLVEAPNYKLGTLAEMFSLDTATHDARDDVLATVGLLGVLINKLRRGREKRREIFARYSGKFITLAGLLSSWQTMVRVKRPSEALLEIWRESGLKEYYTKDKEAEARLHSFSDLTRLFKDRDDSDKSPETAIRELVRYASLVRDIDFLGLEEGKIPIITIHQAKGLEFDHIFLVGLNEFRFPVYRSDQEEERRLFYVALTRARKKIFLSYSRFRNDGAPMNMSPFISAIDGEYLDFISS